MRSGWVTEKVDNLCSSQGRGRGAGRTEPSDDNIAWSNFKKKGGGKKGGSLDGTKVRISREPGRKRTKKNFNAKGSTENGGFRKQKAGRGRSARTRPREMGSREFSKSRERGAGSQTKKGGNGLSVEGGVAEGLCMRGVAPETGVFFTLLDGTLSFEGGGEKRLSKNWGRVNEITSLWRRVEKEVI